MCGKHYHAIFIYRDRTNLHLGVGDLHPKVVDNTDRFFYIDLMENVLFRFFYISFVDNNSDAFLLKSVLNVNPYGWLWIFAPTQCASGQV